MKNLKISREWPDVISDLLIEIGGFLLLSLPGYMLLQEWLRLTITIVFFILCLRVAAWLRKKSYDNSE